MVRIAIAGPDGAGKSSLSKEFLNHYSNARLIHAVKHHNHLLKITTIGYKGLKKAKSYGLLTERLYKYLIFYPIEYLENFKRFNLSGNTIIYDRHPIDRVIQKEEFLQKEKGSLNKLFFIYELIMRSFWSKVYLYLFPKVDVLIVLLPSAELCMLRSNNHYKTKEEALNKINAYKKAIDMYKKRNQNVIAFYVDEEMKIDDVFLKVLDLLKENEK